MRCRDVARLLPELDDPGLEPSLRDRVMTHLAHGCPACRHELVVQRRLRRLLRDDAGAQTDTGSLASRLVAIAGDEADQPLWLRSGRSGLPTLRLRRARAVRRTGAAAAVACGTVMAVGWVAAPPERPVADPVADAARQLAATSGSVLGRDASGAYLATHAAGTHVAATQGQPRPVHLEAGEPLSASEAARLLASSIGTQLTYHGEQVTVLRDRDGYVRATMLVDSLAGVGRTVSVEGAPVQVVLPEPVRPAGVRHLGAYRLSGALAADTVAGLSAAVVDARRKDGSLAARWWVHHDTGLVLWTETYTRSGRLVQSTGFTSVTLGDAGPLDLSAFALATGRPLGSDAATRICARWVCPPVLDGLQLLSVEVDRADDPTRVTLTYSDGATSVSVVQRRGSLPNKPAGMALREGCYEPTGRGPEAVVWQSGRTVFTVIGVTSDDRLRTVADELPHDAPVMHSSAWTRIRSGWAALLGLAS